MTVTGRFEDLTEKEKDVLKKHLDPVGGPKSLKDKAIDTGKKAIEVGKDVAKKILPLTPAGPIVKIAKVIKDKTKKKTGVTIDKSKIDKPTTIKTGPDTNPGSSNPKRSGRNLGGRMGYKNGSVCKMTTKGRGRAYGKNS